jgi:hypothetical protein
MNKQGLMYATRDKESSVKLHVFIGCVFSLNLLPLAEEVFPVLRTLAVLLVIPLVEFPLLSLLPSPQFPSVSVEFPLPSLLPSPQSPSVSVCLLAKLSLQSPSV